MLPYVNRPFEYLSGLTGASPEELKLIFLFLLSYPLAGLLKRVPDHKPWRKNLFIVSVSVFYLVGLFDLWDGLRTLVISAAGVYAIAYYIQGPWMPWIGFTFLMGHMSLNHIWRKTYTPTGGIDVTGAQMVLVMKLSAFCWNVHDGRLKEETLNDQQKNYSVRQMPGILDYAAFAFFFPSLMAGPAFDFVEYQRWIETTMFEVPPGTDPAKAPRTRKKRKIPRSATPAMIKAGGGLLWIIAFLVLNERFSPDLLLSDKILQYNFFTRVFFLHMVGFTVRTKYYGVWALTEGACILSGIGYKGINPKTGKVDWSRLVNVEPLGVELAQNSRAYLGHWNINTNNWLRNYVYLRVTPKGKKPGFRASMATFVTSAFWHGFEPGYYMTFVLASFIQTVAKNCRRYIRPLFLSPDGTKSLSTKRYYDMASWLFTQLAFSFCVAPFVMLSWSASLTSWRIVHYYCIIGVALLMAFFASPGKAILKQQVNAHTKNARAPMRRLESTNDIHTGDGLQRVMGEDLGKGQIMGLPDDPERDFEEIMTEIRQEIDAWTGDDATAAAEVKEAVVHQLEQIAQKRKDADAAATKQANEILATLKKRPSYNKTHSDLK